MPISEAKHKANERYNAKAYDEIKVRVSKGRKEQIRAYAESKGISVNNFINEAIDTAMEQGQRAGAGNTSIK